MIRPDVPLGVRQKSCWLLRQGHLVGDCHGEPIDDPHHVDVEK